MYKYAEKPQHSTNNTTNRAAKISAGSFNSAEQCVNDSSAPDGQCISPSHIIVALTHALISGH